MEMSRRVFFISWGLGAEEAHWFLLWGGLGGGRGGLGEFGFGLGWDLRRGSVRLCGLRTHLGQPSQPSAFPCISVPWTHPPPSSSVGG